MALILSIVKPRFFAQANRDAGIREAECEKAAMDVKYNTDTKIEDNSRAFKLQKANFDKEVNTAKAEAQLAYELQAAKIQQKIRNEEIQIQVSDIPNWQTVCLIDNLQNQRAMQGQVTGQTQKPSKTLD